MKPTYEELECRLAALAAENAGLKGAKEIIRPLNVNREEANFCGIDDCHIDDAIEAMITPATDRFSRELMAQGIDQWIASRNGRWNGTTAEAERFAQHLREAK